MLCGAVSQFDRSAPNPALITPVGFTRLSSAAIVTPDTPKAAINVAITDILLNIQVFPHVVSHCSPTQFSALEAGHLHNISTPRTINKNPILAILHACFWPIASIACE
jgi:hypothetical protein